MPRSQLNLFVGPKPPPLGGVAVVNESFQQLSISGIESDFFNTSKGLKQEDLYKSPTAKEIAFQFRLFYSLWARLRETPFDYANVFVTSGLAILRDILFLLILKIFRVKTVVHFHSKYEGEFALIPWRLKIIGRIISGLTNAVIFISPNHKSFFGRYFPHCSHHVIENFVSVKDFQPPLGSKNNLPRLLFVGRLSKEKGVFDLLHALAEIKNLEFRMDFLGEPNNDKTGSEIRQFIEQHGLANKVHLHGNVVGDAKFEFFRSANCLVFPSQFENSPVVLKEALAADLEIIASDINANVDILDGMPSVHLFKTKNRDELTSTLKSYITSFNPESIVQRDKSVKTKIDDHYAAISLTKILELL